MANIYTGFYKRFNGTDWDTIYFKAPASAITETDNRKWLTATQQGNINTYLQTFNAANKLLKLDSSGKILSTQLPFTIGDYLKKSGGTMTGDLNMGNNTIYVNDITSGGDSFINMTLDKVHMYADEEILLRSSAIKLSDVDGGTVRLQKVANPEAATDAANKQYVDQLISTGTNSVESVKAATTANVTTSGLGKIDNYQLIADDRVLVKNQTDTSQNGIYIAKTTSWTKIPEDSGVGVLVFVEHGNVNNDSTWMSKETNEWLKFSQVDLFEFGEGLTKSGEVIKLADTEIRNKHIASNADISVSKLGTHKANENRTGGFSTTNSVRFNEHVDWLWTTIKRLRGTPTSTAINNETISGAYTEIAALEASKNRTYIGTAAPSGSSYISGDIYIHHE